ncbi:coiled-coil domain-containing protein 69 [Neosynchiropus ocellatus]
MGCRHSKRKVKKKNQEDGGGPRDVLLEKQLERFEWQLRILRRVLSANECKEMVELLKEHAEEDLPVCSLVLDLLQKVKTETTTGPAAQYQCTRLEENGHLIETFKVTESKLKNELSCLEAELQNYNRLKQKVDESTLRKTFSRNVEVRGSPGDFWECEHESLLFVIEMKNERVQEQSRRLQQMDVLVQKNQCLEDQLVEVLRQNEDLRVRAGQFQSTIQKLSTMQHKLMVALEKQEAATQTLAQEKEQLMFKLRR